MLVPADGFLNKHAELWAMLGVNLGLSDERCREIAARVAMQQYGRMSGGDVGTSDAPSTPNGSSGPSDLASSKVTMDREEFNQFHKAVVQDPRGQLHFFQQCVFAAYDADGNGSLDTTELEKFLDVFYQAGSIFKGDARLPEKAVLQQLIYAKLDQDGDGLLSFDEIQSLISGSAAQVLKCD